MDSLENESKAGRGGEARRSRGIRRCSSCSKPIISDASARKQPLCLLLAKQNICIQTRGAADINRPEYQPISPTLWENAHSLFFPCQVAGGRCCIISAAAAYFTGSSCAPGRLNRCLTSTIKGCKNDGNGIVELVVPHSRRSALPV